LRIITGDKKTWTYPHHNFSHCRIGLAVSAIAQPAIPAKEMVVTPFEQVKFVPIDPIKPNGNQIAVAEGNPASGPSLMYLKFKKGVNPTHVHSSDYRLVVLQGTMKHWSKGRRGDCQPFRPRWFLVSTRQSAGAGMDGGEVSGVITNALISFSLVRESDSEMYEHSPGLGCLNSGFAL